MPNEELIQRGYFPNGQLEGDTFGLYERLSLGNTTIEELLKCGLLSEFSTSVNYPFQYYKTPQKPTSVKPDTVYCLKASDGLEVVAIAEHKSAIQFLTEKQRLKAQEQALFSAAILGTKIAIATDGTTHYYIDVKKSLSKAKLCYLKEHKPFNPGTLADLLKGEEQVARDAGPLAEKVWQAIWHATKEEPRQCLLTFVDIFITKFLSDNLATSVLPTNLSFYELTKFNAETFQAKYGKTQIEYYVQAIRPKIKQIFPEKTTVGDQAVLNLFGHQTIVSSASIINGFAFLKSSATTSLATFNRTFLEILHYFQDFGPLTKIDPEFKLRLYETFLKKTARQQKLGQFLTPRNVVKAIIRMAEMAKLAPGSVVLDPASGVGGFILEPLIEPGALPNNVVFAEGKASQKVRMIGLELDINTHILAKANTLIHFAESLNNPAVTPGALNQLMSEMFILANLNEHLGSLEWVIKEGVDLILTNPPYVTQGSKIYKDEIEAIQGLRNKIDLRDYYERSGLGLEALFIRYISGALKPGGRAFIIVPQGLLTRTEGTTKSKVLAECNLIASIALPRNTFFNTPQKTYILALEKRHTAVDARPPVFCAISSSIGESLDARRVSTPTDNTLDEIAGAFVSHANGKAIPELTQSRVRIVDAAEFTQSDRWDVQRFWTDDELVKLGAREEAIYASAFISEANAEIATILEELSTVQEELENLEAGPKVEVRLGDSDLFRIRRGRRVTRSDADKNPGDIPVYSGSKDPTRPLGRVAKKWADEHEIPIEKKPIITINANGYVGATFVRREKCIIHDDVMIIEAKSKDFDLEYLAMALRSAITAGNYEYEAKLYSRVSELVIEVPVQSDGKYDLLKQEQIAAATKRFDTVKEKLASLGKWADAARIKHASAIL